MGDFRSGGYHAGMSGESHHEPSEAAPAETAQAESAQAEAASAETVPAETAAARAAVPAASATTLLRDIPAVDHVLRQPVVAPLIEEYPRGEVVAAVRAVLEEYRAALREGRGPAPEWGELALRIREKLYQRARPHLRRVVNATGIVLHTGLGRAPLAPEAVEAIAEVAGGYCNLELHLPTGQRGDRHEHCRELLRELSGAADALVVNNNAAATYLTLHALAAGREVVVSRGQLVEIGGSYRLPEIMAAAGCRLVEVGTTNRTRVADYERAISPQTAVLLRVHTSNYRIQGFVQSASLGELAALARRYNLVLIDDLGSGLLDERLLSGLAGSSPAAPDAAGAAAAGAAGADWDEPGVRQSVAAGADLTLFSGDKLLGGPQAGIIVGRSDLVAQLRQDPIMRTVRPDKMTLAGLEATLRLYRDPAALFQILPVLRMLARPRAELEALARQLAQLIAQYWPAATVGCEPGESFAGGGALPLARLPTWTVEVRLPGVGAEQVAAALRNRDVPIIARVHAEAVTFDCRTLEAGDEEQVARAVGEIAHDLRGP